MIISRIQLKNWRNFRSVDVPLQRRQFLIGPNASGKSNFLDVFRFLRDIASTEGGGLQKSVKDRGGVSKIRSLAARQKPEISIEIHLADAPGEPPGWRYGIGIEQETRGYRRTLLTYEQVWRGNEQLLNRPDDKDEKDSVRLTQTFLEQINANHNFREIADFFQSVTYLHLVPQLLRFADSIQGRILENDPFGQGFLERIAKTPEKTRRTRLKRIEEALKTVVPLSKQLEFVRDESTGRAHLQTLYTHWRPKAGWQREDQFSDGTLRLIGVLWALLEGKDLLLLEEPELSLNSGITSQLAPLINKMQRTQGRQVLISTHSDALLDESGIDGREVLMLTPNKEGTHVETVSDIEDIKALLDTGFTVGEAALPRTKPSDINRLSTVVG
ncbi:MAG: AAA family ATPase [Gammaproteobacteria bacterium]|nr:AAA family ATPase [Gammaproteobacteria bacterium]NNJ83398.1 AAA family ATPase [Gammaproteobacteria bacterium]